MGFVRVHISNFKVVVWGHLSAGSPATGSSARCVGRRPEVFALRDVARNYFGGASPVVGHVFVRLAVDAVFGFMGTGVPGGGALFAVVLLFGVVGGGANATDSSLSARASSVTQVPTVFALEDGVF